MTNKKSPYFNIPRTTVLFISSKVVGPAIKGYIRGILHLDYGAIPDIAAAGVGILSTLPFDYNIGVLVTTGVDNIAEKIGIGEGYTRAITDMVTFLGTSVATEAGSIYLAANIELACYKIGDLHRETVYNSVQPSIDLASRTIETSNHMLANSGLYETLHQVANVGTANLSQLQVQAATTLLTMMNTYVGIHDQAYAAVAGLLKLTA
jgi:hypothetical protein